MLLRELKEEIDMQIEIEIDEKKILTEILEFNGTLHDKIKREVESRLVDSIVSEIESEFIDRGWSGGKDEIWSHVLDEVKEKVDEVAKKILKEFYDSYRYGKKDITILKKLKDLLGETN